MIVSFVPVYGLIAVSEPTSRSSVRTGAEEADRIAGEVELRRRVGLEREGCRVALLRREQPVRLPASSPKLPEG